MHKLRALLLFTLLAVVVQVRAQDIHFSQFNLAPLSLNPALTGAYEGTFRVGGIYRDQWASVFNNQFVTPSVFVDAPAFRGFGKKDWVGLGAVLVHDQAGVVALTNTSFMASASYHLALDGQGNNVLSIGAQGGYVQRRIDTQSAQFEDAIQSGQASEDLLNIVNNNVSFTDFQAGLLFNSVISKGMNFNVGFSMFHIGMPTATLYNDAAAAAVEDADKRMPRRMVGHGQFNVDLNDKFTLSPTFLYQRIAGAQEINVQAMAGYHLSPAKDVTFNFGAGYRVGDAAQALVGVDYKGLRVGVAYDVNVSDLSTASANRGGFEIAAMYTAKIYQTPVVKPVIFCPRF